MLVDQFATGCDELYAIMDVPDEVIDTVLDKFEETCTEVVDVDVDGMMNSTIKTVMEHLEFICGDMKALWEQVDGTVDQVNNSVYKRRLFLMLILMMIMILITVKDGNLNVFPWKLDTCFLHTD